jgi:hypothetical protein
LLFFRVLQDAAEGFGRWKTLGDLVKILLLTATIAVPSGAPGIARTDPVLRLQDYKETLAFYTRFINRGIDRIVFAENTGFDLQSLREIAAIKNVASSVDFVSFHGNDFPPSYGRCFGEAIIFDQVMQNCGNYPADTIYWKSTGRYQIQNFDQMMKTMPQGADFYCDLRRRGSMRWADMRIMAWTRKGYDEFLANIAQSLREDINETAGEIVLYHLLANRFASSTLRYAKSFAIEPLIHGFRAQDNRNWSLGRQRLVYHARSVQRRVLGRVIF